MHTPDVPHAAPHRWHWHSPAVVRLSRYLYPVWLLGQLVAWFAIAGQAGSPRPDHWSTLEEIASVIEIGMLAAVVMLLLAPPWTDRRAGGTALGGRVSYGAGSGVCGPGRVGAVPVGVGRSARWRFVEKS